MTIYKPLEAVLKNLFDSFEYEDLVFLCETALFEGENTYETNYYLALGYEHLGKSEKALEIIRKIYRQKYESRFLYIRLLQRNKKYSELKMFFQRDLGLNYNELGLISCEAYFGPFYGSVFKIIAEVQHICGNFITEKKMLGNSLRANPFLWSSVEKLAHLRENPPFEELVWPIANEESIEPVLSDDAHFTPCADRISDRGLKTSLGPRVHKSTPVGYNLRKMGNSDSTNSFRGELNTTTLNNLVSVNEPLELRIIEAYKSIGSLLCSCENYLSHSLNYSMENISEKQRERCYVQALMGSCYFHVLNFSEADKYFNRIANTDPSFTYRMDEYSSTLWQLKEAEKLKLLFENLLKNAPLAFQTWTVAGNYASLKNQPQKAISYFKRSKFLNENNPYSSTLLAQEKLQLDDVVSAEYLLKNIIQIDPLHYQAWYYIGKIRTKQHKYKDAIHNLQRAQKINQNNTLINTLLGYSALKSNKFELALSSIERAITFDPKNLLLYYEKAYIFYENKQFNECIVLSNQIKDKAPLDCALLLLLAKAYSALNMRVEAIHNCASIIRNFRTNKTAVENALALYNTLKNTTDEECLKLVIDMEKDILKDVQNVLTVEE